MPSEQDIKELNLLREKENRAVYNRISLYDPYPYQLEFHKTGSDSQRLLMAANRIGKSYCGASRDELPLNRIVP